LDERDLQDKILRKLFLRQARLLGLHSKDFPSLSILFILSNLFSPRDLAASKDIVSPWMLAGELGLS
jgi:hypothetical protein